jgi:hypothetical protein
MRLFVDRVHRLPRIWSNRELERFAGLFEGDVVNVSGWKDIDKEGRRYKDYFTRAASYSVTNFKAEVKGMQGLENEIFLDLERELPPELAQRFDVVFNHTTLEHVYEARTAFANLCRMSRDVVIVVLPFLQPYHSTYGDYWRFSPLAVKRLCEENGFELVYQSFNNHPSSAVYVFSIATRQPGRWKGRFDWTFSCEDPRTRREEPYIGCHALPNWRHRVARFVRRLPRLLKGR